MGLQQYIIYDLTKSGDAKCANTAVIAGNIYMNCMNFADVMRELATDNEQICACAANRAAQEFERAPRLNVSYINSIRRRAMQYCFNPRNRTFGGTYSST